MAPSLKIAAAAALLSVTSSFAAPQNPASHQNDLLTDINVISRYWGQLTPYQDNPDRQFGVKDAGLPDGCQIEQVHTLQRHAQRYPTSASNSKFAQKVHAFLKANPDAKFEGSLSFLNSYQYTLGTQYLTGVGATTEFASGV